MVKHAAQGEDERCEHALVLRSPGERVEEAGGRCPNRATRRLFNGEQAQGQACDGCARRLVADHPWLTVRPVEG
jgi:hypothetical protein